jgi:hypothetical protein
MFLPFWDEECGIIGVMDIGYSTVSQLESFDSGVFCGLKVAV